MRTILLMMMLAGVAHASTVLDPGDYTVPHCPLEEEYARGYADGYADGADSCSGPPRDCGPGTDPYVPCAPEIGKYSVPGACAIGDRQDGVTVTMTSGMTLKDAYDQLYALSEPAFPDQEAIERGYEELYPGLDPKVIGVPHSDFRVGGTILVPWDIDTVECDTYYWSTGRRYRLMDLTIRGIPGPNGELPEFYCRSVRKGGTIEGGVGTWMHFGYGPGKTPFPHNVVIDHLEIDGYGSHILGPESGRMVVRNSFLHHATGDGILTSGVMRGYDGHPRPYPHMNGFGAEIELCGSELSHSGQGNGKHGIYLHGCHDQPDDPNWSCKPYEVTVVDNNFHDCSESSCLKSTANIHRIEGNTFSRHAPSDPSFERDEGSMMVDVVACANNVIRNNTFNVNREAGGVDGSAIGIRNRRSMYGCDNPPGFFQYTSAYEAIPDYDSSFWQKAYWDSLGGDRIFQTLIEGNTFEATGYKADIQGFVQAMGTFPNRAAYQFSSYSCLIEPPEWWYERSRVYLADNVMDSAGRRLQETPPEHGEQCDEYMSDILPDDNLIEVLR